MYRIPRENLKLAPEGPLFVPYPHNKQTSGVIDVFDSGDKKVRGMLGDRFEMREGAEKPQPE